MQVATAPLQLPASHDAEFVALLDGFRPSGGLARAEDLLAQLSNRPTGAELQLARWIAHGNAVSIRWSHSHWLPLFQFRWPELCLQPAMDQVLAELRPVLTSWELAQWFCAPNAWLNNRVPADLAADHPVEVLNAARGDRFILAS